MELTYTTEDISNVARQIIVSATSKTLLFYGDMGVGKTTLIKEIAKQLGVMETLGSPTFSIVNEYKTTDSLIYHFDFYRINNIEEAYDIGIEDYFYSGQYIFIEWPEKITKLLPLENTTIHITKNQNQSRTLTMKPMK